MRLHGLIIAAGVAAASCGQDVVEFPESTKQGECGAWYASQAGTDGARATGTDTEAGSDEQSEIAVEEGAIFPCAVWQSVQLAGKKTFFNFGQAYLEARFGDSDRKSIVMIVSADKCASCAMLIKAMAARAADFDAASATVIGMARRELGGSPDAADFDLEKSVTVMRDERWPTDSWPVTNDPEHVLDERFDEATPWVIIVDLRDMRIQVLSNDRFPVSDQGVDEMLSFLGAL